MNERPTQTERVLSYIRSYGSITQMEAMSDLGVYRLASRISELKKAGYNIIGETEAVKNRFGEKCYVKRYREGEKNGNTTSS